MLQTYLHIGSHKTGTKFFQHKYFPNINKDGFLYNPDDIGQLVLDLMKADNSDISLVVTKIHDVLNYYETKGIKQLLISKEIMSGDLFSFYENDHYSSSDGFKRLKKAFGSPKIIVSFRFQTDWILSCYRESLHEHHFQTFEDFAFHRTIENGFVNPNYKNLDYKRILDELFLLFKKDNVNILFYENFKKDKTGEIKKIEKILGVSDIKITDQGDKIPNRGYSAFAVNLSLFRYRLLRLLFLDKLFIHRPIKFFGENSIPAGNEKLSILSKKKYWGDYFLRDNEEVRSSNYPNALSFSEKLKLRLSWRYIIKELIDKIYYFDWDLASKHRPTLDEFFIKRNMELYECHKEQLKNIPSKYLEH